MRIDFHNHFYPPGYLEKFEAWGKRSFEFVPDKNGIKIVKQKGARFLAITPQHVSVEQRIADMDRIGIDMEVLTLTSQQKMTGMIIGGLPIGMGLLFMVINSDYMSLLFTELAGQVMLLLAVALEGMGILVMKRILAIEV